jgi:hypothetical protein
MISKNSFFQVWPPVQIRLEPKGEHDDNEQEEDKSNEEGREALG